MMRLKDGQTRSFQAPVDVHTSQDGQIYLFGSDAATSGESSDEDKDSIELRPRGRECQWSSVTEEKSNSTVFLVREVVDGDNLNIFALQYGCSVADLKRVNHLIREQDFFALKTIKIPVKKHSLLTEAHEEAKRRQVISANNRTSTFAEGCAAADQGTGENKLSEYFEEIDKDIEKIIQSTDQCKDHLEEVVYCQTPNGVNSAPLSPKDVHHGADWGIRWWNAVVIMLLVGIIVPIFYVVYFKIQETDSAVDPTAPLMTGTTIRPNGTISTTVQSKIATLSNG
ncbi:lysM and putative peptidoglycan-binding domain-containing protein 4 [Carcharodon carcharias]|uniref:lysM and putative peptidoglycan-binding domain-containing protein 4 n=1 Tax=Carcharodon carcharias TaxID=13397 RepID=UPI001B7DEDC9|nr:lysM and putative peptidoglycan-binding domain-containing protein 4 [Carcharodon carcharias]XP_041031257.1 lysM and putative peptidoglycan-binding domain-containing protein 4 [Carcharodon carcharias]